MATIVNVVILALVPSLMTTFKIKPDRNSVSLFKRSTEEEETSGNKTHLFKKNNIDDLTFDD